MRGGTTAFAGAALLCLLPAAAAGGALALPVLLCLAGALSIRPALFAEAIENKPIALILLALFTAWAAASTLWTPWPRHDQAVKIVGLLVFGLLFAAGVGVNQRLARAAGLAAFIVLAGLLAVEAAWELPFNRAAQPDIDLDELRRNVMRGSVVLLALVWPVAGSLLAGRRRIAALLVIVGGGALMIPFDQSAALAAFVLGLLFFAVALAAPRLAIWGVTLGLAAWMLAAPFVTPWALDRLDLDQLPYSWAARGGIWDYVSARILEQPIIGHGLEASRAVTDRISVQGVEMRGTPVHPHSVSLQIWFETGAIGAALAAAALVAGGLSLARALQHDRPAAAATAGSFAALGLVANLSFSAWAEWWIATLFIAAGLVAASRRPPD